MTIDPGGAVEVITTIGSGDIEVIGSLIFLGTGRG